MRLHLPTLVAAVTTLAALGGCRGEIGEPVGGEPRADGQLVCDEPRVGVSPMRRLSTAEYRYTLIDLLEPVIPDVSTRVAALTADLPADVESLGYRNNANFLSVSAPLAHHYATAAEGLAVAAVANLPRLVACDPQVRGAQTCAEQLIETFGRRAFRRPLASDETTRYRSLATSVLAEGTFTEAAEMIVFAMLQSPNFLHRVELDGEDGLAPVDGYALASRLSYLLWHSMPDEALLAEAGAGRLHTREQVRAQARRMLEDPKAMRAFHFFEEWLDLDRAPGLQRDSVVFPGLAQDLGELFVEESRHFVEHVVFEEDGTLETLLTAPYTYVNAALAQHYRITPPSGTGFQRVALDPAQRVGLLLQGGPLTVHDHEGQTSIVRRGLKVRTDLLCQTVGAPPDDVQLNAPVTDPNATARERLAQHREDPACGSCHVLMDPLGLPLDEFDAVGRFRTVDERGRELDVTGTLTALEAGDVEVDGAADMVRRLAETEELRQCFTTQLFRYSYGRRQSREDACSQQQLDAAFAESGYNVKAALLALTQTDAFLYRRPEEN